MRRRRIIMFFAMIMSMAIIGVGFAAWIITAPAAYQAVDGEITVDAVEIHGWKFDYSWKDSNKIVFGTPDTTKEGYVGPTTTWLTNVPAAGETPIGVEKLTATLHVQGVVLDKNANYEITDTAYVVLDLVGAKEGVNYSKYFTYEVSPKTLSADDLKNGVDVVITFNWVGTNDKNPYDHYNSLECTPEYYNAAYEYLTGLKEATSGLSFKVTLTTINPNA